MGQPWNAQRNGKRNGKEQRRRAATERPEGLTAERATSQGTCVPQHRCQGTAQAKPSPGLSQVKKKKRKRTNKNRKRDLILRECAVAQVRRHLLILSPGLSQGPKKRKGPSKNSLQKAKEETQSSQKGDSLRSVGATLRFLILFYFHFASP